MQVSKELRPILKAIVKYQASEFADEKVANRIALQRIYYEALKKKRLRSEWTDVFKKPAWSKKKS